MSGKKRHTAIVPDDTTHVVTETEGIKKEVFPPATLADRPDWTEVADVDKVEREIDLAGAPVLKPSKKKETTRRRRTAGLMALVIGLSMAGVPLVQSEDQLDLQQSVLKLECYSAHGEFLGSGSCFVVAEKDGYWYAVTAKHCVTDVDLLRVDGVKVEVLRVDPDADVALIRFKKTEGKEYTPLSLADPVIGEACTTVGWAGGTFLQFQGHVAGFSFEAADEKFTVANTGIFPGCSGGVLLNADNEVIGVTVAVAAYRGIWDTVGLFVPMKYVRALMETIE